MRRCHPKLEIFRHPVIDDKKHQDKLFFTLCCRVINRPLIPRTALTLCRSVRYLRAADPECE